MYLLCLCLRGSTYKELSHGGDRCKLKVTIEIKLHMRVLGGDIREDFTNDIAYKQRLKAGAILQLDKVKKYSSRGHTQSHRCVKLLVMFGKQQAVLCGAAKIAI